MTTTEPTAEIEAPATDTYEVEKSQGTITLSADPQRGEVRVEADGRTVHTDEMSSRHGAVMLPTSPKLFGAPTKGVKLDDETFDALKADLEAATEYAEAVEAAEAAEEEAARERIREALLAGDREATTEDVRRAFDLSLGGTVYPEAVREAVETGERAELHRGSTSCRDSGEECSTDIRSTYVTPEGEIEVGDWRHTY